jgi:hypothetical protein
MTLAWIRRTGFFLAVLARAQSQNDMPVLAWDIASTHKVYHAACAVVAVSDSGVPFTQAVRVQSDKGYAPYWNATIL